MNKYVSFLKDGQNQRRYFKWLLKITSKSKRSLIGLFILNTCVAVASVSISLVNKHIVDQAEDKVLFPVLVVIMVALQLFAIFGRYYQRKVKSEKGELIGFRKIPQSPQCFERFDCRF